jgi:starch-binding outer membrane protein, SusD/RagB family
MNTTRLIVPALAGVLLLGVAACDLDVPDLNNPGLDLLQDHPDAVAISKACTGLLIGNRGAIANEFGYVDDLGILGRESYNFDTADPRFVSELIAGTLSKGSPFGGGFWTGPYANIWLANQTLHALDKVPAEGLSDADKSAVRGFVHTIMALDLLQVIVTRDSNGAVIDTDHALGEPLGAIVSKPMVYAKIVELLDGAVAELDGGGAAFPFLLSSGFDGFDIPHPVTGHPTSFRMFNRAIKARVAAYIASDAPDASKPTAYQAVLDAVGMSFIDDDTTGNRTPDFDLGVYYTYSTKTGDATNGLINPNIFAHPSLEAEVAKTTAGKPDDRFTRKVAKITDPKKQGSSGESEQPLKSDLSFSPLYPSPESPVGLIRNEELILLRAEALFFTGDTHNANVELNKVRTLSGLLEPAPETTDRPTFVAQLLYERRYSLLFEGGHRWIDLRRFGQPLPLDRPDDKANVRFPIPLAECNARPSELACMGGST